MPPYQTPGLKIFWEGFGAFLPSARLTGAIPRPFTFVSSPFAFLFLE